MVKHRFSSIIIYYDSRQHNTFESCVEIFQEVRETLIRMRGELRVHSYIRIQFLFVIFLIPVVPGQPLLQTNIKAVPSGLKINSKKTGRCNQISEEGGNTINTSFRFTGTPKPYGQITAGQIHPTQKQNACTLEKDYTT